MTEYKALIYDKNRSPQLELNNFNTDDKQSESLAEIDVQYSGINYKDALGVTGKGAIYKTNPVVPGIDLSGICRSGKYKDQKVLAHGEGLGEEFDGGYTQKAFVDEKHLIALPEGLSLKEAMAIGTAGFTAALAYHRMTVNGQTPEKGPVLITGATGGVGGFAVQIFSQLGYEVHTLTHRKEKFEDYLKDLGASEVHDYETLYPSDSSKRPLEKAKWGGVVDNLGGVFLEQVIPEVHLWGNVSMIGMAKGVKFNTTVMPFILRGVSLLGASSNNCSHELREEIWKKLGEEWKPNKITELIEKEIPLEEVLICSEDILAHKFHGRALVNMNK